MVILGDCILNENFIVSITPYDEGDHHDWCMVAMRGGGTILCSASIGDARCVLEEIGLMVPRHYVPLLSASEVEELQALLNRGFRFAAADSTGQVYAYTEKPTKGQRTWNVDSPEDVRRLYGEFAVLSFEDNEPLDIAEALHVFGGR